MSRSQKDWEPRRWWPWMEKALSLWLACATDDEIAAQCRRSLLHVRRVRRSEAFRTRVADIEAGVRRRMREGTYGPIAVLEGHSTEAAQKLVEVMQGGHEAEARDVRQAAVDVLAHVGLGPAQKHEVRVTLDGLIAAMTRPELDHFIATQQWPERLEPEARRLLATG